MGQLHALFFHQYKSRMYQKLNVLQIPPFAVRLVP